MGCARSALMASSMSSFTRAVILLSATWSRCIKLDLLDAFFQIWRSAASRALRRALRRALYEPHRTESRYYTIRIGPARLSVRIFRHAVTCLLSSIPASYASSCVLQVFLFFVFSELFLATFSNCFF